MPDRRFLSMAMTRPVPNGAKNRSDHGANFGTDLMTMVRGMVGHKSETLAFSAQVAWITAGFRQAQNRLTNQGFILLVGYAEPALSGFQDLDTGFSFMQQSTDQIRQEILRLEEIVRA